MAMAATAATLCVASPSSCSFSTGPTSWECGRRSRSSINGVQIAPLVTTRATAAASPAAATVSAITSRLSVITISSSSRRPCREWRWQAVAEQLQAPEIEETLEEGGFPTDTISIFFEADGTLPEASAAKLTTSLEEVEGVSDVDVVAAPDGTATVKLTKTMSVQATGVASGLVDILLKGGFKLQALNLGFDEEDGDDDDLYEYDIASSTEESEAAE